MLKRKLVIEQEVERQIAEQNEPHLTSAHIDTHRFTHTLRSAHTYLKTLSVSQGEELFLTNSVVAVTKQLIQLRAGRKQRRCDSGSPPTTTWDGSILKLSEMI